jgi:hypothetical protein
MSKLLPHFFSVALVIWIYGGTSWYQKKFCCGIPPVKVEKTKTLTDTRTRLQNATQLSIIPEEGKPYLVSHNAALKPLNLYFKNKKYQFFETPDLETYFTNLNQLLYYNPNSIIKVTAYAHKTEGVAFAKKRLDFMRDFLYNKKFPIEQILFENKGIKLSDTHNVELSLKSQLIEIRLMTP